MKNTTNFDDVLNKLYLILDEKCTKSELAQKRFVYKIYRQLEKIGFNKFDLSSKESCRIACMNIFIDREW